MSGYDIELMLPDGWIIVPTSPDRRRETARIVEAIITEALPDTLPRDRAEPWRGELRRHLSHAVEQATDAGAGSVGLPVAPIEGVIIPASFTTALQHDPASADRDQILAELLADAGPDGELLEIGGGPAVRVEHAVDGETGPGGIYSGPTRRVAYYLPHPDAPGVWALTTFTTLADGSGPSDFVDAVVALFDAIMTTLRWRTLAA